MGKTSIREMGCVFLYFLNEIGGRVSNSLGEDGGEIAKR